MNKPSATVAAVDSRMTAVETPQRSYGRHRSRRSRGHDLAPLFLLTPAGLVICVLTLAPIIFLVITSFTDYSQKTLFTGIYRSVGLAQYQKVFVDPQFWSAFARTLVFTSAMVAGSIFIGMGVSQLLTKTGTVMRYVVTVTLIFAWAMPNVASSMVWGWLFQPGFGILNWILTKLHVFGNVLNVNWTQSTVLGFLCIWLLIVWQAVPFIALTLNAAQQQVDPAFFEAARLDGANEWRVYWTITLQFLRPTLLLVTILSVIWDFNVFNQIWLLTQGGPDGGTTTLGIYTYKQAFVSFNIGNGAAISVVTTLLLMVLTSFYIRSLVRSGEEL